MGKADNLRRLRESRALKLVPAALMHALKEAGWIDCGRLHSREHAAKKHIFCAPELAGTSKSELRRMAEKVST